MKIGTILILLASLSSLAAARRDLLSGPLVNDGACDSCKVAVRVFDDLLCDSEAADVVVDFIKQQICPVTGQAEQCAQMTEMLAPVAIEWFRATATPEEMCSAAGVCGTNSALVKKASKLRSRVTGTGLECPLCDYIVSQLQAVLLDPNVQGSILSEAEKICAHLPEAIAAGCTDFVDTYEPVIMTYLNTVNATTLCALMGACPAVLHRVKLPPVTPHLALTLGRVAAITKPQELGAAAALNGASNDMCDNCKMSVIEAHSLVTNPAVQADITAYAKQMCDTVASGVSETCKSAVDAYAPLVFGTLAQVLDPDSLCTQVHLCKPKMMQALLNSIMLNPLVATLAGRMPH